MNKQMAITSLLFAQKLEYLGDPEYCLIYLCTGKLTSILFDSNPANGYGSERSVNVIKLAFV